MVEELSLSGENEEGSPDQSGEVGAALRSLMGWLGRDEKVGDGPEADLEIAFGGALQEKLILYRHLKQAVLSQRQSDSGTGINGLERSEMERLMDRIGLSGALTLGDDEKPGWIKDHHELVANFGLVGQELLEEFRLNDPDDDILGF